MELQIIHAHEFIRVGPQGKFDLKASRAALAALAGACRKRGISQALVDLRALHPGPKPVFSPDDLVVLVNTFREIGFTHQERLAILYGSDPHHRARLFAFIAKLRGWSVQAFDNYEQALSWLSGVGSGQPESEKEYTLQPKPVPVQTRESVEAEAKSAVPPVIPIKSKPARGRIQSRKGSTPSQRRRRSVMRIMKACIVLFFAGALLAAAAGCATKPHTQLTQDMLVASGFKVVNATTPAQQAYLKTLTPGKIVLAKHGDKTYYVHPDAAHHCLYAGDWSEYLNFLQTYQDA